MEGGERGVFRLFCYPLCISFPGVLFFSNCLCGFIIIHDNAKIEYGCYRLSSRYSKPESDFGGKPLV